jgi:rod shape-determining protein MreD
MITVIRYFLIFVMLLFMQVFVLDNIPPVVPFARPVLFFFFVLVLPQMPSWSFMLLGFLIGFIFDIFYQTPGINSAACVLLAFIRNPLLKIFKDDEEDVEYGIHVSYLGFSRFFFYILFTSFIFHLVIILLSVFSFAELGQTLLRIGINTAFSVILIYIFEIIFFYRKAAA